MIDMNHLRKVLSGAALAACFAMVSADRTLAETFLFLENTDSGDLSVISVPGHEIVRTIQLQPYLDDVAASSDGRVVYVNRAISMGHPFNRRIAESGEIYAIDTRSGETLWSVGVNGWPHHMTLGKDDRYLYVPLHDQLWLAVIDTEQGRIADRLPAPVGSHGTLLSPDGERLYVGSMMNDVIAVYDLASNEIVRTIPFRDGVRPFVITKDEKTLYVQLSRLHGFEVVDLETGDVLRTVELPELPESTVVPRRFPHTVNHGLALSPDERYLLAAGSLAAYVAVYHVPGLELAKVIPVGDEPNWIVFSPDGKYAYVSNRKSHDLSVIDIRSLEEEKRIPVGKRPQRMTVVEMPQDTG